MSVIVSIVEVMTLGCWLVDRSMITRALGRERGQFRTDLARLVRRHRQELAEADRRREADVAAALVDPVTDLPTRRAWEPAAQERLRSPAEVALLDVDGFKQVNDTHGHVVGDYVLRTLAGRLQHVLGPGALLGRAGGDELVIVAEPGVDWRRVFTAATVQIRLASGCVVRVGASIGVVDTADLPRGSTLTRVLTVADEAMYAAKRRGGGCHFATKPLDAAAKPHARAHNRSTLGRGHAVPARAGRPSATMAHPDIPHLWPMPDNDAAAMLRSELAGRPRS